MRLFGELCLLGAFVGSGFAAFACIAGWFRDQRPIRIAAAVASVGSIVALTIVTVVLGFALLAKDFRFEYVTQYSSTGLPWHYSLSALWVGQAGSLLLWAWFMGLVAVAYRWWPGQRSTPLREPAFGLLMAYVCFLVAIMVFAADPMAASISRPTEGDGLSPLLQHPAMLIHPPVVFLGYSLWAVPFALATAAFVSKRLDADWVRLARPWSILAWSVLGVGILLGAEWAYEELGWGGYWSWDPVENGSLIPWLTGTALIHTLLAWQYRGVLKKMAICLAIATFGLCNFATFLTRSGIFSSLHAFSKSPIGWLFLVLMIALAVECVICLLIRRRELVADRPTTSVFSREALVLISTVAFLLLAATALIGTMATALSGIVMGKPVMVGPAFYNNVLIPIGLVLLATTAAAPLLRWGGPPQRNQRIWLLFAAGIGVVGAGVAMLWGARHPLQLAIVALALLAAVALCGAVLIEARRRSPDRIWWGIWKSIANSRRQYAGFLMHMGFVCIAVGVTGSSVGTRQQEFVISEGETITWAGRTVRLAKISERAEPDKLVAEAELEIAQGGRHAATLRPAQHFHLLQRQWTTEVAIHSTWAGDFYTILHSGEGENNVRMTLVENPLMRWLWLGGWIVAAGTVIRLWPTRRRSAAARTLPIPHDKSSKKQSGRRKPRAA
jgi:cytochrome c-type biogenesis protein CcmF